MTSRATSSPDPAAPLFDIVGNQFLTYYDDVSGMIRRDVVRQNLLRVMATSEARILDIGCGEGRDAIWLAERGHNVVAFDISDTMLRAATERRATLSAGAKKRVAFYHGDELEAAKRFGESAFDVVVAHGVIMYQEDDFAFAAQLSRLAKPGGIVSVLAKNASALAFRAANDRSYDAARYLVGRRRKTSVGRLGVSTRSHKSRELKQLMRSVGIIPINWYGVKIFSDDLTGIRFAAREYEELLGLELQASRQDPYRSAGRLLHMIGTRTNLDSQLRLL